MYMYGQRNLVNFVVSERSGYLEFFYSNGWQPRVSTVEPLLTDTSHKSGHQPAVPAIFLLKLKLDIFKAVLH